jgi:hypothetical protein
MRTIPHYLSAAGPKSADKNSDKPDFSRPDKRADKCGQVTILVPIYLDSELPANPHGTRACGVFPLTKSADKLADNYRTAPRRQGGRTTSLLKEVSGCPQGVFPMSFKRKNTQTAWFTSENARWRTFFHVT